jgi:hypothetical protein
MVKSDIWDHKTQTHLGVVLKAIYAQADRVVSKGGNAYIHRAHQSRPRSAESLERKGHVDIFRVSTIIYIYIYI